MVAMDGGRHAYGIFAGVHKLEQGHLCGGILHCNPVRPEVGVIRAAAQGAYLPVVVEVGIQDFFGERQRTVQSLAGALNFGAEFGIKIFYDFYVVHIIFYY